MRSIILAAAALALTATAPFAQDDDVPAAVKARQGQMQIQAHALGIVGGMARGNAEYDAEMATAAAQNLRATSMLTLDLLWPEGTSNEEVSESRALPAIWSDWEGFTAAWAAFDEATATLEAEAGNGAEALTAAVGALGRTCGGCHDNYRQTN